MTAGRRAAPELTFPHPLEPCPKLIINAALTGVIPTRAHSPHVPIEPQAHCKPDMASLTTGSLNFPDDPSVNAPEVIQKLAAKMQKELKR